MSKLPEYDAEYIAEISGITEDFLRKLERMLADSVPGSDERSRIESTLKNIDTIHTAQLMQAINDSLHSAYPLPSDRPEKEYWN